MEQAGRRAALRQGRQARHQFGRIGADGHRPVLEHRPATGQRRTHLRTRQLRTFPHMGRQPRGLGPQGVDAPPGQHP